MCFGKTALMLLLLAATSSGARAADWRQFRGPNGNGLIQDIKLPEEWGSDSSIKWKINVPGEGWSAPIVVGQKVFVTTAVSNGQKNKNSEHDWKVICIDATTGKILWTKVAIQGKPRWELTETILTRPRLP